MKKTIILIMMMLIAVALFALAGCSKSNSNAHFDADSGEHVEGWLNDHGTTAMKAPSSSSGFASCQPCHGTDFSGGMSKQSCYGCHGVNAPHPPEETWLSEHQKTDEGNASICAQCHLGDSGVVVPEGTEVGCFNSTMCHVHPTGWDARDQHGAAAKAKPDGTQFAGFASCEVCHGSDFTGGSSDVSCFTCHGVDAPHSPEEDWLGRHTTTDTNNAPVCAQCHLGESGVDVPADTPVGCFNSTLCHGVMNPHPEGWDDPAQHGVAAKSAPGNYTGFAACQVCHGTDFNGGGAGVSCFDCHGGEYPHATPPWIDSPYTHTNTNRANAAVCANCHEGSSSTPPADGATIDCFNNTLCHGPKD